MKYRISFFFFKILEKWDSVLGYVQIIFFKNQFGFNFNGFWNCNTEISKFMIFQYFKIVILFKH